MQNQKFPSGIDTWLIAVLGASILVCLAAIFPLVTNSTGSGFLLIIFVLVIGIGLPLWILTTTCCTVDYKILSIKSGPFSWRIPLSNIESVTDTRDPLSGPALSLDRFAISYGGGKSILVSPKDKPGFLAALGPTGQGEQ